MYKLIQRNFTACTNPRVVVFFLYTCHTLQCLRNVCANVVRVVHVNKHMLELVVCSYLYMQSCADMSPYITNSLQQVIMSSWGANGDVVNVSGT